MPLLLLDRINNTSGTANAVAVNDNVTGSVLGADLDFDWFSFTAAEEWYHPH